MTRSRVSVFMNKFRKLGLINYNGKTEVNSSLLNAVLLDKPEIKCEPGGDISNGNLISGVLIRVHGASLLCLSRRLSLASSLRD